MSPHILIDEALEPLQHPVSEPRAQAVVVRMITNMLTVEEFNHYCQRLLRITRHRKEAA